MVWEDMRSLPHFFLAVLFLIVCASCDSGGSSGQSVTASIDTQFTNPTPTRQATNPKKWLTETQFPVVVIETNLGTLRVQLDLEKAPITGKNFLWYARNEHYDGTIFHQVMPDYMALGGGYSTEFEEKPTQFWIRNEAYNGLKNLKGTIAMARRPDQADSSTCQFFFNLVDNPHLDHKSRTNAAEYGYCVFGKVIEGQEVLESINRVSVADRGTFRSVPQSVVVIQRVTVEQ